MRHNLWINHLIALTLAVGAWGCSSTKHVPQGKMLLDDVAIKVVDNNSVKSGDLKGYLRQIPNHKVLGFAKLQLATYSLSGRDTTKWYNRWLRKLGQAPVIYDPALTDGSVIQLERALQNQGYLDAKVTYDTVANRRRNKMDVTYRVRTGVPHKVRSLTTDVVDPSIDSLLKAEPRLFTVKPGDNLDRNRLDAMRGGIVQRLQREGYYAFVKDNISFTADTAASSKDVDLTMSVRALRVPGAAPSDTAFSKYYFGKVVFVTDYNPRRDGSELHNLSGDNAVDYRGVTIVYGPDRYISAGTLESNCFIERGEHYSPNAIERTYEALGRLGILKSVNIQVRPVGMVDGRETLDVFVLLERTKKQGVTVELEGTNSEGDLGFGVGVTYQHRDIARRSQLLTAKLRANYESLSGDVDGLLNDRYSEYAAEIGLTIPKFEAPFLSRRFKRNVRATTEFALSFNYQERPEYTRVIAGGAWRYNWSNRASTVRRTFDLVDVSYVYLPRSTINFIDEIAPTNPLLRYSYEDHFIMRMGYTFRYTNRRAATLDRKYRQPRVFSLRASSEIAGNALYALSALSGDNKVDGAYRIFGIQYAQYAKGEFDYSWTRNVDTRNTVAMRFGGGIGYPYGNSRMIPFEKRFYAGGANSVRGWSARALGPGCYDSRNSAVDFINQCGDISLLASVEYRAKLFWLLEGALFVDAGNIWTIHNYPNQPGGFFRFKDFGRQIAASYGVGLRFDFTYFLLRLDLGMKAHNPAVNQQEWPLTHPEWHRDATFHFAVGYPF